MAFYIVALPCRALHGDQEFSHRVRGGSSMSEKDTGHSGVINTDKSDKNIYISRDREGSREGVRGDKNDKKNISTNNLCKADPHSDLITFTTHFHSGVSCVSKENDKPVQ